LDVSQNDNILRKERLKEILNHCEEQFQKNSEMQAELSLKENISQEI
jgi:hypothetical protein